MRPWMIVLSSAVVATVVAAMMAWPALSPPPASGILPALMPLVPELAVAALAIYALCAIALVAGNLVALSLHLRRHLAGDSAYYGPPRSDWAALLAASGLRQLAPPPAFLPRPPRPDGAIMLQSRFCPAEAHRAVARLGYIWAARSHFFSALIALAAAVALGVAQQHGPLPLVPGPIPTVPAGLIVVGLILLAILARLAVDVTIEPLIEAISGFPVEPVDTALLRRAVELLEAAPNPSPKPDHNAPAATLEIPDRLVGALEEGHRVLSVAIERLMSTTDELASATRSSIEARESMFHAAAQREPPVPVIADTAGLSQLREAMEALTAALQRVPAEPVASRDAAVDAESGARRPAPEVQPGLADELKQLLQEIATAP